MQGHQSYQPELFSIFNMEALIPKNHLLRQIDEKIDFEFVREMTAELYCPDNGRPSVDPVLFVRICLLTYLYNIPSDRQVCEEIRYNLAYRWFCRLSLEDAVPDHSSLTRIRDRLGEKTFKNIFDHVVRLCIEKGFVSGEKVMMDGSLMKADAALDSLVPKPREDAVDNIKDHQKSKYIKGKKFSNDTHVSKTDPDCDLAGKLKEPKQLRYKVHETIDRESRVVLDTHITAGSEVDGKLMFERLEHIENTFGRHIEEFTGDRGYGFGVNLEGLKKRGTKSFVPNFRPDVGGHLQEKGFKYDKEKDVVICPQGIEMQFSSMGGADGDESSRVYTIKKSQCRSCPRLAECLPKSPDAKVQSYRKKITVNLYNEIQEQTKMREKTAAFQVVRGERQWKMEGIFAEAKDNHGLDRARYRGRAKVQIQAYMIGIVQNIKRMMGNGPVVEIGLHQAASGSGSIFPSISPQSLNYYWDFLSSPVLLRVFQQAPNEDGQVISYYVSEGSMGGLRGEKVPDFQSVESLPMEEQLIAAGFVKEKDGIFKLTLEKQPLTAVVNRGQFQGIFVRAETAPFRFDSGAEITGIEPYSRNTNDMPTDHLVLENQFFRGLYSSSGFLEKTEIKVDASKIPLDIFGIKLKPVSAQDTFVRGGRNETESISDRSIVNGLTIGAIGYSIRQITTSCSGTSTPLLKGSLSEKLKKDNDTVLAVLNLTHQKIGHAFAIGNALSKLGIYKFNYNGKLFAVNRSDFLCGSYSSPFRDGLSASKGSSITFKNLETGESIRTSGMAPSYIEYYGFYESELTPEKLANFFGIAFFR